LRIAQICFRAGELIAVGRAAPPPPTHFRNRTRRIDAKT
jgi:hypothetical protein